MSRDSSRICTLFPVLGRLGLVILCAVAAGSALAADDEFSVPPGDPADTLPEVLPTATVRLELGGGVRLPIESDLRDDYGLVPGGSAGLTVEFDPQTQFVFALGYERRSASLDLDDPTFESDIDLKLELVPLHLALRKNTSPLRSMRMNLGLYLDLIYVRENVPYYDYSYAYVESGWREDDGFGTVLGLSFGPEWRTRSDAWGAGFELQAGAGGASIGDRDFSLEHFSGRVYVSRRLGIFTDEGPDREVER